MTTRTMVDLFCGLGGASEAFFHDQDWEVLRIDNNSELLERLDFNVLDLYHKNRLDDIVRVIRMWNYLVNDDQPIDFIWASPPCKEFSINNNFSGGRQDPDLTLIKNTKYIIDQLEPKWHCIENVHGACTYFEPIVGKHKGKFGPYYLWGNVPMAGLRTAMPKGYAKNFKTGSKTKFRANIHAKIPMWLSETMKHIIESQTTLSRWI